MGQSQCQARIYIMERALRYDRKEIASWHYSDNITKPDYLLVLVFFLNNTITYYKKPPQANAEL